MRTVSRFGFLAAFMTLLCAGAGGLATGQAVAATCPNEELRQQQGVGYLPSCMALEVVSPMGKQGAGALNPMIAEGGERAGFFARAALAGSPGYQDPIFGDFYVAERQQEGWTTLPTSPPSSFGFTGFMGIPVALSPDLGRWFSIQATLGQAVLGQSTVLRDRLGSDQEVDQSPLLAPEGVVSANIAYGAAAIGTSEDMSHLYLLPGASGKNIQAAYLPTDPLPSGEGGSRNAYVVDFDSLGQASVSLLSRDEVGADAGKVWGGNCGATVGGGLFNGDRAGRNQGAVSADGVVTLISTRPGQAQPLPEERALPTCDTSSVSNPLRIMRREESAGSVDITELFPSALDPGDDYFEGASADGTKVFFTTTRQLAASDQDSGSDCIVFAGEAGCDLYMFDSSRPEGQRLVQVSAGEATADHPVAGSGGGVYRGIAALAGDGSRAYFVASGVLTDQTNPEGALPALGGPNLYVYEAAADSVDFIGTLASSDNPNGTFLGQDISHWRRAAAVPMIKKDDQGSEIGGDGHILAFLSNASLTADDLDGGSRDVFRYDSNLNTLVRVSKAASGGSDNGAYDVAVPSGKGMPQAEYAQRARWVSEDGSVITFGSSEALLPADIDEEESPYMWRAEEGGQLFRLPGTEVSGISRDYVQPTVSQDGDQVAFVTTRALVPQDGDGAADVYVARANGGFRSPPAPDVCVGDSCQGELPQRVPPPSPPTPIVVGVGNIRGQRKDGKKKKDCKKKNSGKKKNCKKKAKAKNKHKRFRANAGEAASR